MINKLFPFLTKKRQVNIALCVFLTIVIAFSFLMVGFQSKAYAATENSDVVDIELNVISDSDPTIQLGKTCTRSFKVTNLEQPAYIRLTSNLNINDQNQAKHDVQLSDGWIYANDGYYYFTTPLDSGSFEILEESFLFNGTEDFLKDIRTGDEIDITEVVTAEAIQSQDMYPDFSADEPWKGAYKASYEPVKDTETISSQEQGTPMPQTGDNADIALWIAFALIAIALCLIVVTRLAKTKKSHAKDKIYTRIDG